MSDPVRVQLMGCDLIVINSDGSRRIAHQAPGGMFYVGRSDGSGPTPEPNPEPNPPLPTPPKPEPPKADSRVYWPFPLQTVTTEWMGYSPHYGMDFGVASGTPILSPFPQGKVVRKGGNTGGGPGNYVILSHGNFSGYGNVFSMYMHMLHNPTIALGRVVSRGARIGTVGSSGNSTGPHLHWQLFTASSAADWVNESVNAFNPRTFMREFGRGGRYVK